MQPSIHRDRNRIPAYPDDLLTRPPVAISVMAVVAILPGILVWVASIFHLVQP